MNNSIVKPFELGYVKKRILTEVRKDFEQPEEGVFPVADGTKFASRTANAVYSALVEMSVLPTVYDDGKLPFIDENTSDDFKITLSELALEALVCLAASKLCTEDMSNTYVRLLYKYKDLTEGLFSVEKSTCERNSFYRAGKRGIR